VQSCQFHGETPPLLLVKVGMGAAPVERRLFNLGACAVHLQRRLPQYRDQSRKAFVTVTR
ncbi:hypothetical protein K4H02_26545, partial [Mycobacterium tuberculosis]|nr:hypothetical protein [Mycobacterium tuberculosis]